MILNAEAPREITQLSNQSSTFVQLADTAAYRNSTIHQPGSDSNLVLESCDVHSPNELGVIISKPQGSVMSKSAEGSGASSKNSFKDFLTLVFGAIDSETLEGIGEKLMAALPEQLTSLVDDIPDALKSAASFLSLETEEDEEEEEEGQGGEEGGKEEKITNKDRRLLAEDGNTEMNTVAVGAAFGSQPIGAAKPKVLDNHEGEVSERRWLIWDWILFWGSVFLALASLFILTALANTTCSCSPQVST